QTRHGRSRSVSFAALHIAAQRAAHLMQQEGIGRTDKVLIFHPMSIELYVALVAIFQVGAVAMFLDPSAGKDHIERCCELGRPVGLIAGTRAHQLRLRSQAVRSIAKKFVIGFPVPGATRWSRAQHMDPLPQIELLDDEAPALITFTSGSTDQPKAAVRTHGFLLAQYRALKDALHLTAGQIDLTTMPIVLLANLASGLTSVIPDADLRAPGLIEASRVITQIREQRPTSTVASPAFLDRLARFCETQGATLPTLERVFAGGAPVFPALLDRLQRMAPNAEIVALYGSTEAEPIARIQRLTITKEDRKAMRGGAGLIAGKPVRGIRLRIIPDRWGTPLRPLSNAEFDALCLPRDQPGEIVVTGAHVLRGYLHRHGDVQTKFRAGKTIWHRTGDAGRLDRRGRLWLLGRCAAKIDDQFGTTYPLGAECAAQEHPGVARSAFVAHNGKRVLVVEPDTTQEATPDADALHSALAWAHIDELLFVNRIPVDKRHNAKIDYPALHRLLATR
ncbi:MAG: AMP-binding protein, partial [Planctomycetota bacterium]|nr:AMP-binding protein [Planctomycetota bacterium]